MPGFNPEDKLRDDDFINESDRDSANPSNDEGKLAELEGDGYLSPTFLRIAVNNNNDGDVILDGNNTFSFASLSGSTYTLTRPIFAGDIEIQNGITLNNDGYLIFCEEIRGSGVLKAPAGGDGGDGSNGSDGGGGGSGGSGNGSGLLAGIDGGDGGSENSSGSSPADQLAFGPNANNGGAGGGQSPPGSPGQGGNTIEHIPLRIFEVTSWGIFDIDTSNRQKIVRKPAVGAGGGAGGDGSGASKPGGGGGAGASGAGIFVLCKRFNGSFTIKSLGGDGGDGGCDEGINEESGGGGGGAGGNGGSALFVYHTKSWSGSTSLTGGAPGSGTCGGNDGQIGNNGTLVEAHL